MGLIWGDCLVDPLTNKVMTLGCLPGLVGNLVYWLLVFAGTVALFFIIFSGIKFLTSQGDPKQVEGARKTLTWAIAGLILVLSSFAILIFIANITGAYCILLAPSTCFGSP